ncbi:ABC transporter ATP-binding protein [Herpetosiphon giganteus]|uniref:ABC transporter ATP-binding protein n=1 Tax=Herpetosiphon giganteus TaxID=2029754 RepID=UPI00195C042E|nr:ABC transporter ATP-binding protein [Herpetosiphon giganteus]MBM7846417.1 ATP-binding cassette subfamily B protein/subfamily B ATP-binding cassette protein MsbA [Herpetosiphon giganteus]
MTTKALAPSRKRDDEIEKKVADLLPKDDENSLGKAYDPRLMRRLLAFIVPYKRTMTAAIGLMIIGTVLSVVSPWVIGQAIDVGIKAKSLNSLYTWTIIFAVVSLGEWLSNRSRIHLLAIVGTGVVADVRSALFRHLQRLSLNFYNRYSVGRLMSRLISDVDVLQDFVTWSITGLTRATFSLVGITLAMLWLNWKLALVTFAVLPIMVIVTNYWRVRVRQAYRSTRERIALINGYLNESISGIRVTKSFVREEANGEHFDDLNRSYFNANTSAARLAATFFPAVDFMGSLATALVVGVGGWLVVGDELTPGVLVAFVLYVSRFFDPILELAQRYNTFQSTMASSERMFALLDTEPDMLDAPNAKILPAVRGHVMFDHVSFGYADGEPVLRDVTLEAQPGETIALVGETGAGKSTIIRLLGRFFDVTDGAVLVDGHDIRDVTQASLRQQLGIVLQDTFLFGGSISDNIRYGRLDASDEAVIAAAKAVGAHEFIERMPEGYNTDVGENGVNLSVGQRQILSFARALLADPRLLILDEATSSVDTTTERQIQAALDTLMRGRTSFVIAHRLSTITSADKIVVLDRGQISEMGTHAELLARKGRYYNLYTMQWSKGNGTIGE